MDASTTTRNSEQHTDVVVPSQSTEPQSIQIIFREIHKNAWLRRIPNTGGGRGGGGAYSKRGENVWVVFCVHDDRDPYLEVYVDQKVAAAHRPDWCAPLATCLHVTPTICASQDGHHEFVVTLRTGVVKLAAPTWDLMMEWVSTLRSKLEEMKILTPPENLYSQPPQLPRPPLLPTRDPNSPLPPTPAGPRSLVPGIEPQTTTQDINITTTNSSTTVEIVESVSVNPTPPQPSRSRPPAICPRLTSPQLVPLSPIPAAPSPPISSSGTRENVIIQAATTSLYITQDGNTGSVVTPSAATADSSQNVTVIEVEGPTESSTNNVFDFNFVSNSLQENSTHYEHLYLGESSNQTPSEPISPLLHPNPSESRNTTEEPPSLTTSTQTQTESSRHLVLSPRSHVVSRRRPPPRLVMPIPIALEPRRILQPVPHPFRPPPPVGATVLTLREQQVLQLGREMRHPGGVRLQLRKKDCVTGSIALVDAFGAVWVAGWKQREHPTLYNALHIGDRLLSVTGVPVPSSAEAHRLMKQTSSSLYVELVVRRVPCGRVLAIRREHEGQDLGLELEGGTAEVKSVRVVSPAARAGLPPRAPTCDGLSLSNWVLTEVNSRPLNLFFKDGEVRDRLNAVGMDVSILVQPFDLIKQIKKQLKALRGYKEYLVQ